VNLFELSEVRRQAALRVMREAGVVEAWESVGALVNLVGSVRSGLIMKNLDIDFHIYTDEPMLARSRGAIARLKGVRDVRFRNLLDTEEECLEWHAAYAAADGATWQLDMIHIRRGSAFDGVMEQVTDAIVARLDPSVHADADAAREAILRIKHDAPDGTKTPGIEVYHAVLELGLRTYEEFAAWKQTDPSPDLLGWRQGEITKPEKALL
jgi:hypothetical protein